jgi:hypothetical protein
MPYEKRIPCIVIEVDGMIRNTFAYERENEDVVVIVRRRPMEVTPNPAQWSAFLTVVDALESQGCAVYGDTSHPDSTQGPFRRIEFFADGMPACNPGPVVSRARDILADAAERDGLATLDAARQVLVLYSCRDYYNSYEEWKEAQRWNG